MQRFCSEFYLQHNGDNKQEQKIIAVDLPLKDVFINQVYKA